LCNDPVAGQPELCISNKQTVMKKIKLIFPIVLIMLFLLGLSSCFAPPGGGNPRGWNKNSNNPHHPNSTNPGKGHDKH
jgi:hypothetical protein